VKRAGLAVLSVLVVVGSSTVAWGHGSVTHGGDRVHTCVRSLFPRIIRVITPSQACTGSEQGIDIPQNGTLNGVVVGAPVAATFTAAADVVSAPITVACTPDPAPPNPPINRVVGVTIGQAQDLALAVSRPAGPTAWEVAFVAPTPGVKVVNVSPICMSLFFQP